MIDDYVQESPQQSLVDEQWNTMAKCVIIDLHFIPKCIVLSLSSTAAEQALAVLTYIYTCKSVQSQTQLKARVLS